MKTTSDKLHILYTIPNFDTAGSGKVVYDLVNRLDRNMFKVSIACGHDRGAFFKEVEALGVRIHLLEIAVPIRPYYNMFQRLKPYRDFLKNENVDLVHSWHWSSDWSEPMACFMVGVPFVYTKKSMGWGNIHWKIRSFLSTYIITVNTEMRAFFPNKKQQELIPFGLETSYYNNKQFKNSKETSQFKLITVANLVAVKNIEMLLQAIHQLKHLPIHLDIVGDMRNDYVKELQILIKDLQLDSQVSFLGKHLDVRPLLAQADLYVISSKKEGMPMALVEAMAMQLPVLGSNIPGIAYVLQDFTHLLFSVSDVNELVEKIRMIYAMPREDRQKLGSNLRHYCEQHFSMKTFIEKHEDLYLKLVKH